MTAAREIAVALGAAVITSILYAAAYPPYRWTASAWVALVPFLIAVRSVGRRGAIVAAIVFPVLACALTISWMPRAAATYYGQPFILGIATFLAIALVMIAPYVVAFTFLYRRVARHAHVAVPLYGAALWVCGEYARSYVLTGNPFVLLGYSQAAVGLVRQIADLTGVYGISFVVAAVNVAVAEVCVAAWHGRGWSAARQLVVAAVLVGVMLVYGGWRVAPADEPGREATSVLLVQGNLDLGSQWRDELYGRNLDVYLRLTAENIRENPPALVVWPENAMTFFLGREPLYRMSIGRVLSHGPVQLLTGGPHYIESDDAYLNSAFLVAASGEIEARYDKEKLLPFAEYFPLPQLDVLQRNFGRVREFTPGGPAPPLPSVAGPAGVLICNEAMFPDVAARRVRAGAELLVNLANDSWISDAQYAELALDMSVFRAVEQRRYVIRSSTSGPSAIIDPQGRIRARTEAGSEATLRGVVERRRTLTPYARLGDLFVVLCGVLAGVGVWRGRGA